VKNGHHCAAIDAFEQAACPILLAVAKNWRGLLSTEHQIWQGSGGAILAAIISVILGTVVGLLVGNSGAASGLLPGTLPSSQSFAVEWD
jgi:ABC-type nitrate/sulfonate/bicarbonate transport system permease component